jgi:hypothetical protein
MLNVIPSGWAEYGQLASTPTGRPVIRWTWCVCGHRGSCSAIAVATSNGTCNGCRSPSGEPASPSERLTFLPRRRSSRGGGGGGSAVWPDADADD